MGDVKNNNIEVPSYFICPISLEIMKDPVTLSTGMTYDRVSIEKWLYEEKNNTCPMTKQTLIDEIELTPNHNLRRLIQSWCTLNPYSGVERAPTPRLPLSKSQILKLLIDSKSSHLQMKSLKRLKEVVLESEANKRSMEAVGAVEYLTYVMMTSLSPAGGEDSDEEGLGMLVTAADQALSILYHLSLSERGLKALLTADFMEILTRVMQRAASYESQTYAVMLLKSVFEVADPVQVKTLNPELFTELLKILKDEISKKATKAALKVLIMVCARGRNRVKAAEAGVVGVLIETLLDSSDKRVSEMVLMVLEEVCKCAEGRSELLKHSGGLAVVSKKILRISGVASEMGVRILHSVAKYSGKMGVEEEMLELGVVGKLCLVLQVNCGSKTKEKAMEILKMNSRVWKNSSCIPFTLISSYPC